jgi:hypothetical protein
MRHYKLIDGGHEIEIPAMELAFQLSGQIDSEDFDTILNIPINTSWALDGENWIVVRTQ